MKNAQHKQTKRTRRARRAAKVVLLLFSFVIGLAGAEFGYRVFLALSYQQELEVFTGLAQPVDAPLYFTFLPNLDTDLPIAPHPRRASPTWHVRTDSEGFRGAAFSEDVDSTSLRILALGDSYTFGYAIDESDVYPRCLEASLNPPQAARKTRVINAGVPGYNSEQEAALLDRLLPVCKPHMVILGFVVNDAESLTTVPRPPEYVFRGESVWVLEQARRVANRLVGRPIFSVSEPSDNLDYLASFTPGCLRRTASRNAIAAMATKCREACVAFLVAVLPDFTQQFDDRYPYRPIHAAVRQWGIEDGYQVIDLMDAFAGADHGDFMVWGDGHPNARAHGRFATVLREHVIRRLALDLPAPSPVDQLELEPSAVYFTGPTDEVRLRVHLVLGNGTKVTADSRGLGPVFEATKPDCVRVLQNGLVMPMRRRPSAIRVSCASRSVAAPVVARWPSVFSRGTGIPGAGGHVPEIACMERTPKLGRPLEIQLTKIRGGAVGHLVLSQGKPLIPSDLGLQGAEDYAAKFQLCASGRPGAPGEGHVTIRIPAVREERFSDSSVFMRAVFEDADAPNGFSATADLVITAGR